MSTSSKKVEEGRGKGKRKGPKRGGGTNQTKTKFHWERKANELALRKRKEKTREGLNRKGSKTGNK